MILDAGSLKLSSNRLLFSASYVFHILIIWVV